MPQLVLIITVIIIVSSIRKHRRNRPKQKQLVRMVQSVPVPTGADFSKIIKAEQKELEKLKKADQARAERIRTAKFKAMQAENDEAHLEQLQHDLLTIYNYYERIYSDPDRSTKERQNAFVKMLSYDTRMRNLERQHEKAQFTIESYERLVNE